MLLTSTCELDYIDDADSRLIVAPVVFRQTWEGSHWDQIRRGERPAYLFLPPMAETLQTQIGAEGWITGMEAAVVLASATLVSREVAGPSRFSLTSEWRHALQERLVKFFSVRDWKSADQFNQLLHKRIAALSETDEPLPENGRLFKMALENGQDDEAAVGLVLRQPRKRG